MAIGVRLGEKEILAMAADEIDKRLAKLLLQTQNQTEKSNNNNNNNNNVKRRRL